MLNQICCHNSTPLRQYCCLLYYIRHYIFQQLIKTTKLPWTNNCVVLRFIFQIRCIFFNVWHTPVINQSKAKWLCQLGNLGDIYPPPKTPSYQSSNWNSVPFSVEQHSEITMKEVRNTDNATFINLHSEVIPTIFSGTYFLRVVYIRTSRNEPCDSISSVHHFLFCTSY